MRHHHVTRAAAAAVLSAALLSPGQRSAVADSVAQVQTAKRISQQTVVLIDPQGRPGVVGSGSDTTVMPGDIITFVIRFTPVPNGATRGLGGYITDYIPRNTEVVGARIIDAFGNTVAPHRGGLAQDGVGPRGARAYPAPLQNGSMSQLYADTGVFFSTDPMTARVPDGTLAGEQFLSVFNGIPMNPAPTGAGQLDALLGATMGVFAHNQWDALHAHVFGAGATFRVFNGMGFSSFNQPGQGNTPFGYGSAVAGPDTFYAFELSEPMPGVYEAAGMVGPWQRIATEGAEIGTGAPVTGAGPLARMGVPTAAGWVLSPDNPLPAFDPANPNAPWTNAVRFAVGELVVGDEYYAEISLRVLDTPLDPVTGLDLNCAEVFGGDASAFTATSGGKDNTWRYFLPSPACVVLNLQFDLDVDKLTALPGDTLTYTINVKNLSTLAQDNVVVTDCFQTGEVTFVSASAGGVLGAGNGCPDPATQDSVTWNLGTMAPGAAQTLQVNVTAGAAGSSTLNRAVYTSTALPAPGFQVVALTDVEALAILDLALTATPDATSAGGTVHYQATLANVGTGAAALAGCGAPACGITVALPPGFTPVPGTATANGAATANPTVSAAGYTFAGPFANIAPGGTLVLGFDASVAAGTPAGLYESDLTVWARDVSFGKQFETSLFDTAGVAVGVVRSDPPVVSGPLAAGGVQVKGTTSEAAGTTIRVRLNGNLAATTTSVAGGAWSATVPTLFAGQEVTATAQAAGELESFASAPQFVVGLAAVTPCNDGMDNDGDGLVDFPADLGCTDGLDVDETDVPACANGIDDDGDGAADFPADPGCATFIDDDETGPAACANGVDDDGDGAADFPADPGCDAAADPDEADVPACANGVDDDGDGAADFPADDGCSSSLDGDETTLPALPDAGAPDAAPGDAGAPDGGGGGQADAGDPPDPGGVDAPADGCGCRTGGRGAGAATGATILAALALLALLRAPRRRRWRDRA